MYLLAYFSEGLYKSALQQFCITPMLVQGCSGLHPIMMGCSLSCTRGTKLIQMSLAPAENPLGVWGITQNSMEFIVTPEELQSDLLFIMQHEQKCLMFT